MGKQCPALHLTYWNGTAIKSVDETITGIFNDTTVNPRIADIYCSGDKMGPCLGICPNADLSGPGVRSAFYVQGVLNTLLIALCHAESAQASWTATILTAAIVIPAMIQKNHDPSELTLYHATLVLNFATFSTVASLAVAPLCSMWNLKELKKKSAQDSSGDQVDAKRTGQRARIVLSVALIVQIALQWAWAIMLFTTPKYAQTDCSAGTTIVLFGKPLTAHQINKTPGYFYIWGAWIFCCMGVSFVWGALLVFHSSKSARGLRPRWAVRVTSRTCAVLVCIVLLISSEVQVSSNCVLGGENLKWGFGQVTAILLALAPLWPIVVALHERYEKRLHDALPIHLPPEPAPVPPPEQSTPKALDSKELPETALPSPTSPTDLQPVAPVVTQKPQFSASQSCASGMPSTTTLTPSDRPSSALS